jgi:flavodoxin
MATTIMGNAGKKTHQSDTHRTEAIGPTLERRSFLQSALLGGAGVAIGAQNYGSFTTSPQHVEAESAPATVFATPTASKILLAYFSRAGENYYYGERIDLEVGNTEVLADMIDSLIDCDVCRIDPVDPYSTDYDDTVARNVQEQNADARPSIANPLNSIASYDIVLLGSPIWNVRAPMIMSTFTESFAFTGKIIYPLTTFAVSGLGTTERDYAASCPGATIGQGLAVRGEEVRDAGSAVEAWLQSISLLNVAPASPTAT